MALRTDLAVELTEGWEEKPPEGVRLERLQEGALTVLRMWVESEAAARRMGKPTGAYVTVEVPPFAAGAAPEDETGILAREIRRLLPAQPWPVLVVGLGNREITPDALGPAVIDGVLATRHIDAAEAEKDGLAGLRPVAALAPGVLGQTGMESSEIVSALCRQIGPGAVLAVDALAAGSVARLGCTVQLSDAGIAPGAGVLNRRRELSRGVLGVPVVSVGIPTVVDAVSLGSDFLKEAAGPGLFDPLGRSMMVTPREVDQMVRRAARVLAAAVNRALQPDFPPDDLDFLAQ